MNHPHYATSNGYVMPSSCLGFYIGILFSDQHIRVGFYLNAVLSNRVGLCCG